MCEPNYFFCLFGEVATFVAINFSGRIHDFDWSKTRQVEKYNNKRTFIIQESWLLTSSTDVFEVNPKVIFEVNNVQ